LEQERNRIYEQMSSPDFYRGDSGKISQTQARLEELEGELDETYDRWEELESLREANIYAKGTGIQGQL